MLVLARTDDEVVLDGQHGEGGGQILRSALALAVASGRRMVMPPFFVCTSRPAPSHRSPLKTTVTPPLVVSPRMSPATSLSEMPPLRAWNEARAPGLPAWRRRAALRWP